MPKPGPAWDPKLAKERANISGLGLKGERTGEVLKDLCLEFLN